jgi:hypothetical protein
VAPEDEIRDPRAFRWVESGVSGLARAREWDATAIAEAPSLRASEASEVDVRILADGSVVGDVGPEALSELTRELGLDPPYAVRAVRQSELEWIVGALTIESSVIELGGGLDALSLEVAVPPDGETLYLVDGDIYTDAPAEPLAAAFAELERRGAERFQAFVARADRVEDSRWELTVDPL